MVANSHTYQTCTKNFIKIGPAVSEEFGKKNRDSGIYILENKLLFTAVTDLYIGEAANSSQI